MSEAEERELFNTMKQAIIVAYGHLWHINEEPLAPIPIREPRVAANAARKVLLSVLTKTEQGEGIYIVAHMLEAAAGERT